MKYKDRADYIVDTWSQKKLAGFSDLKKMIVVEMRDQFKEDYFEILEFSTKGENPNVKERIKRKAKMYRFNEKQ